MMYDEFDKLTEAKATTFTFSESDTQRILFPQVSFSQDACMDSYPTRLEQLRKKETRSLLHGSVLSQYWRNCRIPRGLRIYKEPTLGRDNAEFCKKWCAILNKCSLDLMLLVIENENEKLEKVRAEMDTLRKEMTEKLPADRLKSIAEDCDKKIETYKRELEQHKMRKYRRDALDYRDNRVYPWMAGGSGPVQRRAWRPRSTPELGFTSASSEGFSTDTESTSGRFLRERKKEKPSSQPPIQQSRPTRGRGRGGKRGGVNSGPAQEAPPPNQM